MNDETLSHTLVTRLPTALPAEVRITVKRTDGSTSSSVATLVHQPLYRVQNGEVVELMTFEELAKHEPPYHPLAERDGHG